VEKPVFSSLPIQQANLACWILRYDFSIFYGKDGKDVKYTFLSFTEKMEKMEKM
jgi:hypothetical protein